MKKLNIKMLNESDKSQANANSKSRIVYTIMWHWKGGASSISHSFGSLQNAKDEVANAENGERLTLCESVTIEERIVKSFY